MIPKLTFFPVGNGDMTLIALGDQGETKIVVDCNIREAADDPDDDDARDVAKDLRDRIKRDSKDRPYVDVFMLTHPDEDHCRGLEKHFYLGPPGEYPDDKKEDAEKRIFIRELWSSPIIFRRASKDHKLCDDAVAACAEARRRVQVNNNKSFMNVAEGDRILVLGEDVDGKTDKLGPILVKVGDKITKVNGGVNSFVSAKLLAPLTAAEDEEDSVLSKNHSSVVMNFAIASDASHSEACHLLIGGDAEVAIWEKLWALHKKTPTNLTYDVLLAPHHCSWHSLSYDSWSDGDADVCKDARSALSQANSGAIVVSSSGPIEDDDDDPPCWGAKKEYEGFDNVSELICTQEYPSRKNPEPLELTVASGGPQKPAKKSLASAAAAGAYISTEAHGHG